MSRLHKLQLSGLLLALMAVAAVTALMTLSTGPSLKVWRDGDFGVSGLDVDVYVLGPGAPGLRLFWKDGAGKPYGSAQALAAALKKDDRLLLFAMNSGIFQEAPSGLRPLGLHVETGKELVPLNAATEGYGNFYLQPNGIFWWGGGRAEVVPTARYVAARPTADYAIQSGPMLVIDGELNAAFNSASPNRNTRAAVGVARDGKVCLAFAARQITLHELATLFRDRLDCPNALYLDGAIVSRYIPDIPAASGHGTMAGILGVIE